MKAIFFRPSSLQQPPYLNATHIIDPSPSVYPYSTLPPGSGEGVQADLYSYVRYQV